MRRLMALAMMLTLMLTCAAAAEGSMEPILIYNGYVPEVEGAVLPGVPMNEIMPLGSWEWPEDERFVNVLFPAGEYAGSHARVERGVPLTDTLDMSAWPVGEVIAEAAELDSVDQNLGLCELSRGDKVRVWGRSFSAWYVLAGEGEDAVFGSVWLDDLAVDADFAAMMQRAAPNLPATGAEAYARFEAMENQYGALADAYGEDENCWPQEQREAYDACLWNLGFYWEPAYAKHPGENDGAAEEAIAALRAYLTDTLGIPVKEDASFRAQFLLDANEDQPHWHVWWDLQLEPAEFVLSIGENGLKVQAGWEEMSVLRYSQEMFDWPVNVRSAMAIASGWEPMGDDQPIAEGMLDEADARAKAWAYAGERFPHVTADSAKLMLFFYDADTMYDYGWNRDGETWYDRPLFRANFYADGTRDFLCELWFDGETGELYRFDSESSGLG